MALKMRIFDPANYLDTEDVRKQFLEVTINGGMPDDIAEATRIIARSRVLSDVACKSGSSLRKS